MTLSTFLVLTAISVLPLGLLIWARHKGSLRVSLLRLLARGGGAPDLDPIRREISALRDEMNRAAAQRPDAATAEADQRIAAVLAALDRGLPASVIADRHGLTPDQVRVIATCHRSGVPA